MTPVSFSIMNACLNAKHCVLSSSLCLNNYILKKVLSLMLTLLGALLGFVSSAFPDILKLLYHGKDCAHELAVMDRQIALTKLGHSQRLEEIKLEASTLEQTALYKHAEKVGVAWVDALSGSVRPLITYAFFLLYTFVKIAQWRMVLMVLPDATVSEALTLIWHSQDEALFAAVMSFWFGSRALTKKNGT